MSKLKALAEKELANIMQERQELLRVQELAKQSIIGREQRIEELNKGIEELENFLSPKKKSKGKK